MLCQLSYARNQRLKATHIPVAEIPLQDAGLRTPLHHAHKALKTARGRQDSTRAGRAVRPISCGTPYGVYDGAASGSTSAIPVAPSRASLSVCGSSAHPTQCTPARHILAPCLTSEKRHSRRSRRPSASSRETNGLQFIGVATICKKPMTTDQRIELAIQPDSAKRLLRQTTSTREPW